MLYCFSKHIHASKTWRKVLNLKEMCMTGIRCWKMVLNAKKINCYDLSVTWISGYLNVIQHFLCATGDWMWVQVLLSEVLISWPVKTVCFDPRCRLFPHLTSCIFPWNFWVKTVKLVSFRLMTCVRFTEAQNFPAGLQCRNCSNDGMHCCMIQLCHVWQWQLCGTFILSSLLVCRAVPCIPRLRNSYLAQ